MSADLTRAARRLAPLCVVFAAAVVALVSPGMASAERLAKCTEGTKINGEGSTLQGLAQKEVWGGASPHAYNAAGQKNKAACPGGPEITYNTKGKTGSGKGMENWYALEEYGPEAQGFAGTDNPPNGEIKTKIEEEGSGGKLLTIPVLQAAITIIVNLPANCTATAEPKTKPLPTLNRLVLGEKTIEKIFRRKITKFSQIKDGKDKLVGTGCVPTTEITRVVREDGSGTTATFKKSLQLIFGKTEKVVNGKTWLESAEEPPANTEWPEEALKLVRGNGSGGVVKKVEETPGSIGYVNLANARGEKAATAFVPPTDGEGKKTFWTPVENGQTELVEGKKLKTFVDPSENKDVAAKSKANCLETGYVAINPETGKASKGKFPPASTELLWNLVSAEKKEINYPLCGFTYDLALTKYNGFKGATIGEATTAGDYREWVLNTEAEGGQKLIGEEKDYDGLPTNPAEPKKDVLKIAQA